MIGALPRGPPFQTLLRQMPRPGSAARVEKPAPSGMSLWITVILPRLLCVSHQQSLMKIMEAAS